MNNIILIKPLNNFDPPIIKQDGFYPFLMTISSTEKPLISATVPYYYHKCENIEYQEVRKQDDTKENVLIQSISNPTTVYFYNEIEDEQFQINETLQIDSKRTDDFEQIEPRSTNPTTLYFVNEEESEP